MIVKLLVGLTAISVAAAATAQQQEEPQHVEAPSQIATSSVGKAGQRQTREAAADEAGTKPMVRISSRIQNRVQSRIRNRIDRFYDPQANVLSPFRDASQEARTASRNPGR